MKAFLLKFKWTILFWLIFLPIVVYFAPRQNDYYLDSDIKYFKSYYLAPILLWMGIIISVILLLILFIKTKSLKQSSLSFLYGVMIVAFYLFIFQDLFLAAALFINRQIKEESLQKSYVVSYIAGMEQTKDNFVPYDLSTKHITIDKKLINRIYNSGLKQNDTVTLKLHKGLFGVVFQPQPFVDK
jgi:hypothetical protein